MKDSSFKNYEDFLSSNLETATYSPGPAASANLGFIEESKPKQKLSDFLHEKKLLEGDYRRMRKMVYESGFDAPLRTLRINQYGFSDLDLTDAERTQVLNLYLKHKSTMTKKAFVKAYGLDKVSSLNWILKEHDFNDFKRYTQTQSSQDHPQDQPIEQNSIYVTN